ncbi:SDR family NAD(P)-dependent oxidoreductase [Flavobacterium sp. MAH-1]|uniref:SDR family NAD(P)-dependent oxidoreductase n=1 Tax=Flavobacterium agri TaxID=2743471 RepID=A0A7Y8Y2X5_9FLAO|nr:SDR family NAD(P)-dependent oxidoreductase [Flavobacterium agri]NYA70265.1 SDR family NAD(P)-dependent oxidoreductase [Flavobacterium agri]
MSILGCGWLGLPLAKTLAAHGFNINGSTTSSQKLEVLQQSGIYPFLIALEDRSISGDITEFLKSSYTLVLDVPPKIKDAAPNSYVLKIRTLIPEIINAGIKNVLFISSTSVYGNEAVIATEELDPKPSTESGKQLFACENLLRETPDFQTTIIRFGGLIGSDRHPIKHLAGKENVENPDAPINLIHREDCLGIIIKIIENKIWGETFNAVAPYHPSREDYYTQKARAMNLPLPTFNRKNQSTGKQISSGKLIRFINYNFLHPEL